MVGFIFALVVLFLADTTGPTRSAVSTPTTLMAQAYEKAGIEALQRVIQNLQTWSVGLFAVVGFALRAGIDAGLNKFINTLLLVSFLVSDGLSMFMGYKAQISLIKQLNQGVFDSAALNSMIELQAVLFLIAGGFSLILLWAQTYGGFEPGSRHA